MNTDCWNIILQFIKSNKNKCNLLMTHKDMINCNVYFEEPIDLRNITKSTWFNNFINIIVNGKYDELPLSTKYVTFGNRFKYSDKGIFPQSVTHVKLNKKYCESVKDLIPSSVTHLQIGNRINNGEIKNIPISIKELICDGFIYDEKRGVIYDHLYDTTKIIFNEDPADFPKYVKL